MKTTTDTVQQILDGISYTLAELSDELATINLDVDSVQVYEPRGTVLKALPNQSRFKPTSMWVSLGNGKYKHLTGTKGLVAKHSRLDGYTSVIFRP